MAKSVIRLSGATLINGSDFDGYIGSHQIFFFKDDLILLLLLLILSRENLDIINKDSSQRPIPLH